ncbi:3'-5' exonuclease [Apiospora kogelbergensis]|uniref:3'-5' exonuclease n=1 Tax=Apiospora kogelbergensis TaxID=1337665 RepID=UPI00312D701B
MNVVGKAAFGARSSARRILGHVLRERAAPSRRLLGTDAVTATAAAAPVVAAAAASLKTARPVVGETKTPPARRELLPIKMPMTTNGVKAFFVDTPAGVSDVVGRLSAVTRDDCLYVDLEGVDLSRYGTVSLLIIYCPTARQIFVLDVFMLQAAAFDTQGPGDSGLSIRGILESKEYCKAFFDVRNDSDALFHHYGVGLRNVEDLQLMENATRPDGQRNIINGLAKSMGWRGILSRAERAQWDRCKTAGKAMFNPATGGSFDVFNARPLDPAILSYCVGDVYYLPRLRKKHWGSLSQAWRLKLQKATQARVLESQQKDFDPHSIDKIRSPWEDPLDWVPLNEYKAPVGSHAYRAPVGSHAESSPPPRPRRDINYKGIPF